MDNLYNWVFHFNPYTEKWSAAKRENYTHLFSGNTDKTLSSNHIDTLIKIIRKTDGNDIKIKKMLKQYE